MQRGLVKHRAGQKRLAILFQRDGQTVEPIHPLLAQMALDPDFVNRGLIRVCFGVGYL